MAKQYWGTAYDGVVVQEAADLNTVVIPDDSGHYRPDAGQRLADYSCSTPDGSVRVLFRDLERRLIAEIDRADIVVGCVAWLTSEPILAALAQKNTVQIVVQKEDFLRPDLNVSDGWRRRLRRLYDALPIRLNRYSFPPPLSGMSYCGDPSIEPVRCVGNHNRARTPAFPRSHHKFVLFCNETEQGFSPYAVWTGSFNFTKNAGNSFENAVILTDPLIVAAYLSEYAQIAALSEPLDWQSAWVAPQWRLGS